MTVHVKSKSIDYQKRNRLDNAMRSRRLLLRLERFHGRAPVRKANLPALIYPSPVWDGYLAAQRRAKERTSMTAPAPKARIPLVAEIVAAVSKSYGVTKQDILGPRRLAPLVRPRQVVMYLARELTDLSWHQISFQIGKRDHTTSIYGHRQIASLIETDVNLANRVAAIRRTLT